MKLAKALLAATLSLGAVLGLGGAAAADQLKLIVAVEGAFPPTTRSVPTATCRASTSTSPTRSARRSTPNAAT